MKKKELKKENKKLKKELQIYKDICQKIIKITKQ